MKHIDGYARAQWADGEADYQKAASRFLTEVLESGDPFLYLREPIARQMGSIYAKLRRAHLESLPPPIPPASDGNPPVVTDLPVKPAKLEPPAPPKVSTEDRAQAAVQDQPEAAAPQGDKPRGSVQGRDDSQAWSGAAPGPQVPAVAEPAEAPVTPTPLQQRIVHLNERVWIKGRGHVLWANVQLDEAVATLLHLRTIRAGIQSSERLLERAIGEMRRHQVQSVDELPTTAAARIFAELAA